jgi:uncharacterized MAPEG superfamily protein
MNETALALIGYIFWSMLLLAWIVVIRGYLTMAGNRAANSFQPDGTDVSPFSGRLCRAHANCFEAFPYIGGILILALVTNLTEITNSLALVVLGARLIQSTAHLISTSALVVQVRFFFFLVQLVICFYWSIQLILRFIG